MFLKLSKLSSTGVLEEEGGAGGGGQLATCLVAKQAVEFPPVLASLYKYVLSQSLKLVKGARLLVSTMGRLGYLVVAAWEAQTSNLQTWLHLVDVDKRLASVLDMLYL